MSFFGKVFSGSKASKSSSKSGSKSSKHAAPSGDKSTEYGLTPEELAEVEKTLPGISRQKDRLSVSKSGRHKYKARQRTNLHDETYGSSTQAAPMRASGSVSKDPSANGPASTHYGGGSGAGSSGTHLGSSSHSIGGATRTSGHGSVGRNSQNGSLGRSTEGHCAVAQQSTATKRYQPGQSRHPTAV